MKYRHNHGGFGKSKPVTVVQHIPADRNRVKGLRELIYQVFIASAPKGRSLPNVVTDSYNGTIDLQAICRDDKRFTDALQYLKFAWTDQPKRIRYEVTDTKIVPVFSTPTRSLDEALMAVYGYNPYLA